MTGELNNSAYGMYPAPVVTCDSRDETGFNYDLVLHRVDRGRTRMAAEGGGLAVRVVEGSADSVSSVSTSDHLTMAYNGGQLPRLETE